MARRRLLSVKTRATLGGVAIAVGSLYALTVSYDIPQAELLRFLAGSLMLLVGAALGGILLIVVIKLSLALVRRLIQRFIS
ncbi:hypothetical protein [Pseudohongiella spirulinae]|uniref:Uncharacterized protein n=1 Tax=Pseudohongiella spirulinae TaxID=1249552 RepID=A0A0S2KBX4_9GAMM|nr:hypothetical protein [Pseudohongiella spirulinae]ALO45669.1 hypothetical protein PS2015_1000 [Pseudohongiella spirulinae]